MKPLIISKIIEAAQALTELSALRLPFKVALALARLRSEIAQFQHVYLEQMRALLESYGIAVNPDGSAPFPEDEGDKNEIIAKLEELAAQEIELNCEWPVIIPVCEIEEQKLTATAIMALEGIVLFE